MAEESKIENPKSKIWFEPKPDAPRPVRVSHGEYAREFDGKWPQAAAPEEWEKFLLPAGLFKEVQGSTTKEGLRSVQSSKV